MSGVSRGIPGRTLMPARSAAIQTRASCAAPASGIVQTSQSTTSPPSAAPTAMAMMTKTLSRIGAAAAAAKCPVALSAPENSAASEISRMYGKMMRP